MFAIIPAIDLKDGKCVRLRQGAAADATVYSEDPVEMAAHWAAEGARYLHVVDLDGAFQGRPAHLETIGRIIKALSIPVEVGGGLRTDDDIRSILNRGADRAIIGTRALADPAIVKRLAGEFGEKLAVGIDARNGMVQVKGWVETTGIRAADLAAMADQVGIRTIIYTDTSRDGMMTGSNVAAVNIICNTVGCRVVASGGVTSPADVRALLALRHPNLVGAIVGKALYERQTTLKELQALV